jgi:hypothetical protein
MSVTLGISPGGSNWQMKHSTILFSVSNALLITLVLQGAGHAAEEATSDKAQWLKDNLVALDSSQVVAPAQIARSAQSISLSPQLKIQKPKLDRSANGCESLRPFDPKRKLVSQKELDAELLAQKARLAPEPSTLTGQISAFLNSEHPIQTNPVPNTYMNRPTFKLRPRRSTNKLFSTPQSNMASFSASNTNVGAAPVQCASTLQPGSNLPPASSETDTGSQVPAQVGFPLMKQAEHYLFEQPEASAEEKAMIDKYAQMEMGDSADGAPESALGSAANAGPPPFPLNLLPQASLKQLVRGIASVQKPQPHKSSSPIAGFGGWRQPGRAMQPAMVAQAMPTSATFQPVARSLPPGGFHSFVQSLGMQNRNTPAYRVPNYTYLASPPHSYCMRRNVMAVNNHAAFRQSKAKSKRQFRTVQAPASHQSGPQNGTQVAVYPPYANQARLF